MNDVDPRDHSAVRRARGLNEWRLHAATALATTHAPGDRCLKCRLPPGDRRRPARHHRHCLLRGAGRMKPLLQMIGTVLCRRFLTVHCHNPMVIPLHVIGWTLRRVLAWAMPKAASADNAVDATLDRFCAVLGYEPVLPLPRVSVALVDPAKLVWPGKPLAWLGPLAVCESPYVDGRPSITTMVATPPMRVSAHSPMATSMSVELARLDARKFRKASYRREDVLVYAESDTDDERCEAAATVAMSFARIATWPGPPEMARKARASALRLAASLGSGVAVELPEQRAERERFERVRDRLFPGPAEVMRREREARPTLPQWW